jgi:hypothetical protein
MVYERIKIATIVLVKWDELKKFFFFFQLCGKECGLSELYQNMCQKNEEKFQDSNISKNGISIRRVCKLMTSRN